MANSKLSAKYEFEKPNDKRALDLMNAAAEGVMKELQDLVLAYGVSDEFSKLVTTVVSTFTSYYVYLWPSYFEDKTLFPPLPSFDGRAVLYPNDRILRDYVSWRQVDCHINNLYNTTFWTLIQKGGMNSTDAEKELMGTVSSDKNEILFSRFGINYNNEPEMFKKGSVLYRDYTSTTSSFTTLTTEPDLPKADHTPASPPESSETPNPDEPSAPKSKTQAAKEQKLRKRARIAVEHVDIIRDEFWMQRPWILSGKAGRGGK
ncbi:MAG: hypothetical protein Q9165_006889 [Trypethelium subeluteriae]